MIIRDWRKAAQAAKKKHRQRLATLPPQYHLSLVRRATRVKK